MMLSNVVKALAGTVVVAVVMAVVVAIAERSLKRMHRPIGLCQMQPTLRRTIMRKPYRHGYR